jgi:hypothetical protein
MMKKVYTVIIISMMVICVSAQNSVNSWTGRIISRNLHNTVAYGNFMQGISDSHLSSSRFFGGNTVYDQKKMLAEMQKLDNMEYQEYNSGTSLWVNSYLDEFTYNANGHNTSNTYSDWSLFHNMYEPSFKEDYNYDASGNMTERLTSMWDSISSQWYSLAKSDYTYDNQGNPMVQYSYYWDESTMDWIAIGKEEYTYASNNLTLVISYIWNDFASEWMNSYKSEYMFNAGGYITTSTDYTWDFIGNVWKYESKTESSYNAGNQLIMDIMYSWSIAGSSWVNDAKDNYIYDADMNMTSVVYSIWYGSLWVDDGHDDYTYNNAYTYNELLMPWIFTQFENSRVITGHMITLSTGYDAGSSIPSNRTIFNYSSTTVTGIAETPGANVNVYPQPASVSVKFSWPANYQSLKLEVSDVSGNIISYQQVEKNRAVSVQNLSPGMYFYRLINNSNTFYTGKLLIN